MICINFGWLDGIFVEDGQKENRWNYIKETDKTIQEKKIKI